MKDPPGVLRSDRRRDLNAALAQAQALAWPDRLRNWSVELALAKELAKELAPDLVEELAPELEDELAQEMAQALAEELAPELV